MRYIRQLLEHFTYIAITIRVVVFSFQRVERAPPLEKKSSNVWEIMVSNLLELSGSVIRHLFLLTNWRRLLVVSIHKLVGQGHAPTTGVGEDAVEGITPPASLGTSPSPLLRAAIASKLIIHFGPFRRLLTRAVRWLDTTTIFESTRGR